MSKIKVNKNNINRKYLKSHPWINFQINFKEFDYELWMLLGEAQSKCEHIGGVPLKPKVAEELHKIYLIRGAQATTAIEGNTLSEEEIRDFIEKKTELPRSKEYMGKEIENIVKAFNHISSNVKKEKLKDLNFKDVKYYNKIVLDGLDVEKHVIPGEIRKYSVQVGGYRGAPPEDCEYLLKKTFEWLNDKKFTLGENYNIATEIVKSCIAHIYIAWIHPFGDGNGRTARLIEFQILLDSGVPSPAAQLLSNHYNSTRSEYYRQLKKSSQEKNLVSFIKYAIIGFIDGLKEQLKTIRDQTLFVSWENYINEKFEGKTGMAQERRRQLILDLSKHKDPVSVSKIRLISPRIAELYANSPKLVYNDINELESLGLINLTADGFIEVNRKIILAFLPFKKYD